MATTTTTSSSPSPSSGTTTATLHNESTSEGPAEDTSSASTSSSPDPPPKTTTPITVDDLIEMATATSISEATSEAAKSLKESTSSTAASTASSPATSGTTSTAEQSTTAKAGGTPSRESQYFSEIIPNLFLTSANHITDENIAQYKITHIVNATRTVPLKRNVRSLRVNIIDSQHERIAIHFESVSDFINDALKAKGRIAVHCISGISRSSTLVIAYLMKYKNMLLKDAFNLVRSKRWFIRPNTGFFRQLVDYEKIVFGINTVKMVWSEAAGAHVPDFILEDTTSNYKYFYLVIKK